MSYTPWLLEGPNTSAGAPLLFRLLLFACVVFSRELRYQWVALKRLICILIAINHYWSAAAPSLMLEEHKLRGQLFPRTASKLYPSHQTLKPADLTPRPSAPAASSVSSFPQFPILCLDPATPGSCCPGCSSGRWSRWARCCSPPAPSFHVCWWVQIKSKQVRKLRWSVGSVILQNCDLIN